ncbi:MAG: sugar nucleotide-binding protein [Acidimicrobiales bacterium]
MVHATAFHSPATPEHRWHHVDLRDGGTGAVALIRRLRPAAVVNAAYVPAGPDLDIVTARAPGVLAEATAEVGARLVHLSSDIVFAGTSDRPYTEDDPPSPVNAYGRAKAHAEHAVLDADPTAAVVRTSLLWGDPPDGGPQVALALDRAATFYTDEIRAPLRVDRLAHACRELAGRPDIRGVLHVAGADAVDRCTFARLLRRHLGHRDEPRGAPGPVAPPRPKQCVLDSSRAASLLATPLPGVRSDTSPCDPAPPG